MPSAEFAYAQARIAARNGARLLDGDWKVLEGAQSVSRFLEMARTTFFARFLTRIGVGLDAHAIERALREEAFRYAQDVAMFAPARWRPAIGWLGTLAHLPLVDGIAGAAQAPRWVANDPILAPDASPQQNRRRLAQLACGAQNDAAARWLRQWRDLWPSKDAGAKGLAQLVAQAERAFALDRVTEAGATGSRRAVIRLLTRSMRLQTASPVAMVCHVGLVLLDMERLRGVLVRRLLFNSDEGEAIA